MKNIKLLNKIAAVGLASLPKDRYLCAEDVENPDGILVRSADLHEMAFGENLAAIARAGAGVNNIPIPRCSTEGIVVFNTPGANANGVKELAICALLLASRDIVGGIEWVNSLKGSTDIAKQVEKGKSRFAGHEVAGKKLGVIGLGAIGGMVANVAVDLGMEVLGCDPYMSVEAAWHLSSRVERAASYEEIFRTCDYITLHVPALPSTKHMINRETLAMMKDGVRLLNLARDTLVNTEDLKAALSSGKVSCYVTDFPTEETVGVPGIVTIPHLGASTEESEDNCAVMAAQELDHYLTYGNIRNSVNYPDVELAFGGGVRLCILHANIPNILQQVTTLISKNGINIDNMLNKSKGDNAYTMVDLPSALPEDVLKDIRSIVGVARVRVISA